MNTATLHHNRFSVIPGKDRQRMEANPRIKALRAAVRLQHYSDKTADSYSGWAWQYMEFYRLRQNLHGQSATEVIKAFLTYLAEERRVAASTQNLALNAVVFLYKHVIQVEVGDFSQFVRAKRPKNLPVVFSHAVMGRGYYHKGDHGRVELGNDMLEVYEKTMHLPESSGGKD